MKERCKETVYPRGRYGSFQGHRCIKLLWKDGYCKIHHPESVEKRRMQSEKRWKENLAKSPLNKAFEKVRELEQTLKEACVYIEELTGSCPLDVFDFEPWEYCEAVCDGLQEEGILHTCWMEYFKAKAKG